jgi:antitoxin HigA-1
MSINREDLDRGRIDFGEVASGERFPPVSPGEILCTEFLEPMGISVYALAKAIKVTRSRVNDIVLGRRAISADTALRLARYFGTTPEFWVNLQSAYDLATAKAALADRVNAEVSPRAA